jgi:hypothetical protein
MLSISPWDCMVPDKIEPNTAQGSFSMASSSSVNRVVFASTADAKATLKKTPLAGNKLQFHQKS